MNIDLSALDTPSELVADGKPKEIPLTDLVEDPNQPRVEFPEDEMKKMAASIKERGVKTPISVKAHPTDAGKWIINHGARRYRGSLLAGKDTIPAFIDEDHNDYDQVMENKERLNHSPLEIAMFIKKKIAEGDKKNVIAKKLNEDPVYISTHLALIDMPDCIEAAYRKGTKSPKTIYDLRKLYEAYPDEVRVFINKSLNNDIEISRSRVAKLGKELKEPEQPVEEVIQALPVVNVDDQADGKESNTGDFELAQEDETDEIKKLAKLQDDAQKLIDETNLKEAKEPKEEDPNKIKKPLLVVRFKERQASLMIHKKPSSLGFAWIKYEDGTEEQVDCTLLEIEYIKDSN